MSRLIAYAFALFALTGCIVDGLRSDEERVRVELELRISGAGERTPAQSRAADDLTADQQSALNQIHILVFDRNDMLVEIQPARKDGMTVSVTLGASRDENDIFRLVVLANAGEALCRYFGPEELAGVRERFGISYGGLMDILIAASPDPLPDANRGIPMWGEFEGRKHLSHNVSLGGLTLFRALARVDVGTFDGSGENAAPVELDNFRLVKATLHNASTRYRLAPGIGNFSFAGPEHIVAATPIRDAFPNGLTTSCRAGGDLVSSLYAAEADGVMGGVYGDKNHAKRPFVIVEGRFKPAGAADFNIEPSYYRLDFVTSPVTGNRPHDILRNHIYRLAIVQVRGPGLPTVDEAIESRNTDVSFGLAVDPWEEGSPPQGVVEGRRFDIAIISPSGEGSAMADHPRAPAGRSVRVLAMPAEEFVFDSWQIVRTDNLTPLTLMDDPTANPAEFIMPDADVTITPRFIRN